MRSALKTKVETLSTKPEITNTSRYFNTYATVQIQIRQTRALESKNRSKKKVIEPQTLNFKQQLRRPTAELAYFCLLVRCTHWNVNNLKCARNNYYVWIWATDLKNRTG